MKNKIPIIETSLPNISAFSGNGEGSQRSHEYFAGGSQEGRRSVQSARSVSDMIGSPSTPHSRVSSGRRSGRRRSVSRRWSKRVSGDGRKKQKRPRTISNLTDWENLQQGGILKWANVVLSKKERETQRRTKDDLGELYMNRRNSKVDEDIGIVQQIVHYTRKGLYENVPKTAPAFTRRLGYQAKQNDEVGDTSGLNDHLQSIFQEKTILRVATRKRLNSLAQPIGLKDKSASVNLNAALRHLEEKIEKYRKDPSERKKLAKRSRRLKSERIRCQKTLNIVDRNIMNQKSLSRGKILKEQKKRFIQNENQREMVWNRYVHTFLSRQAKRKENWNRKSHRPAYQQVFLTEM